MKRRGQAFPTGEFKLSRPMWKLARQDANNCLKKGTVVYLWFIPAKPSIVDPLAERSYYGWATKESVPATATSKRRYVTKK